MTRSNPLIRSYKEIILLLLYSKGITNKIYEPIKGRTRLMKMVFLFKEELKQPFEKGYMDYTHLPDFTAYDFGPFSFDVLNDIEFLKMNDFISVQELNIESIPEEIIEYKQWLNETTINIENERYIPEEFIISNLGIEFVQKKLIKYLTKDQMEIISEFKKRCTRISLRTLLKYVYEKYPKMTSKSKIRNEILNANY